MVPKLSALQWALFAALMLFFGFAVFALTRDYYLRHPAYLDADTNAGVHPGSREYASTTALGNRMRQAMDFNVGPVDLTSTDASLLGDAADRLFAQQRFSEAVPVYERILSLTPRDAETHNDLGLALHYSGRSKEGIEVLQTATDLAPSFQRAWLSLGFVAVQSAHMDLGNMALEHAQSLDPDSDVGKEATRLRQLTERSQNDRQ
jgi:tetratricopeptide (TPR) repeat protein